jgi:hypothetical protein
MNYICTFLAFAFIAHTHRFIAAVLKLAAMKGNDVVLTKFDVGGAYLHAKLDPEELVVMKLDKNLCEILKDFFPELIPHMTYESTVLT